MSFEYLAILILLYITALVLKWIYKISVFKNYKEIIAYYLIIIFIGTIWDNAAVYRGHWIYPGKGILGIFIGLVPLEDYFFAIVCTYLLIVLYKIIHERMKT